MQDDVVDANGQPGFTCTLTVTGETETKNIPASTLMSIEKPGIESVVITGTYTPQTSGKHYLSFATLGKSKVTINDSLVFDCPALSADPMAMLLGTATEERKQYDFIAGKSYDIKIEADSIKGGDHDLSILPNALICLNLGFASQAEFEADLLADATAAAEKSDVAIVLVGHTSVWETEGCDRESMNLPMDGSQDELIRAVAKVNPNVVIVSSTGSPIAMPWLNDVKAVVQAWFPGQEAGYSIADVLLGKVNPSGKLPVTFPRRVEDVPTYKNFPCTGKLEDLKVVYEEGVRIGYRYYDGEEEGKVLFPFGFGGSYTTFDVEAVKISEQNLKANSTFTVSATVRNTGSLPGRETLQVYVALKDQTQSRELGRPVKTLVGFGKTADLSPGQQEVVTMNVDVKETFAHWEEERYRWVVPGGEWEALVATSCAKADVVGRIGVTIAQKGEFEP
ncbi:Beta-glucosidase B [Cyphellophora attinorum]|uniref:beta-glucosidase n=1 Tax=Cyphellophora attinorum TaxID=1664694 RepID=A0A0N1NX91_9EURO|nr:Beta-glucosidase B [Phialophora attinorum]KPI37802.1 Beta-glucosidase B [Phialophora attinorum]